MGENKNMRNGYWARPGLISKEVTDTITIFAPINPRLNIVLFLVLVGRELWHHFGYGLATA